ncbi:hypothetical protein [Bdellovibrio sp. HCB2-146]|uniref:hypothetical protein n=1 Tax=Bdellovibrio sp. HCB2-146 TaxID=3394362 RepID=UPI0039BD64DE
MEPIKQPVEKITPLTPGFPALYIPAFSQFLDLANRDLKVLTLESGQKEVLEELRARGFHPVGIESDPETCKELKESGFEVVCATTNKLAMIKLPDKIGSVWAGGAFRNTDLQNFELQLNIIHLILPDKAPFYFSIPYDRPPDAVPSSLNDLEKLLSARGFGVLNEWDETDLEGNKWLCILCTTRSEGGSDDQKENQH